MQRNSPHQQLPTHPNPHSLLHTHLPFPNPQRFRRPLQRHSFSARQSTKSADKKQYLTLVSKDKKPQKRAILKSNKNNAPKKIQSVILGGERNTNSCLTSIQSSLKSSLCRSCTSLHQRTKIVTQPTLNYNTINVQPYVRPVYIDARPHHPIIIQDSKNQQLNKILSQKLNLDNPQNQLGANFNVFKSVPGNDNATAGFGGKLIPNTSVAGRIYFSVGNSLRKQQQICTQKEKPIQTPRFDKASPEKQMKRRKNAGFIRSVSAPKISYEPSPSFRDQLITPYRVEGERSSKQIQIARCLQKMSSIRREIDQLQDFLQDRLVTSQLKSKFLYNPLNTCLKDKQSEDQIRFSAVHTDSTIQEKDSLYTPINSIILSNPQQTQSKSPLLELKSSVLNVSSRKGHSLSQSQQMWTSSMVKNLYEMKCPTSTYNSKIQTQIISEISSKNTRPQKDNQQNIFYHKNPLHSIR